MALVIFAALGCKSQDAGDKEPSAQVSAQTVIVVPRTFTETLGAIGGVVARAGHVATLSAPAAGHVGRVLVSAGQTVQRGQSLIVLDQGPFQSALQAAQAAFSAAQQANDRQQRLSGEGIVPKKDAETAAAEMARARADVIASQHAAELSVLKAPISGVITRMTTALGASVDPSQVLVEIADPSALDVLLNVTPTDAGRIRPGAKVFLKSGSTAKGDSLGTGMVADIAGTVDSVSRSVAIRVQAPSTRRPLRIGETVFGNIAVGTRKQAIVIPTEALVPEGEGFRVFVVDAHGIAHDRDVKVGGKSDTDVEITAGLVSGERIVTYGAYGVSDSAKIQPVARDSSAATTASDKGHDFAKPSTKPEKP
jgi:membrane fusion protein (multidrug efflux system)